jgi:CMP/dCMP kinase
MIVTIDGPAGAGKSRAARLLAQRLNFDFLDTGAMYRAVTLAGLRAKCDWSDPQANSKLLESLRLEMPPGQVLLNGEDITALIRSPEVTAASGSVASNLSVRQHLVGLQRQIAAGRNFVCEGRDQGTIVFPDALCKFFLFADPEERARRRHRELQARGETISLKEILLAQKERDARDAARDIAPMVAAADAIQLDSTHLSLEQVVEQMEKIVRQRMQPLSSPLTPNPSPPRGEGRKAPSPPRNSLTWMETGAFRLWHECFYTFCHLGMTLGFSLRIQGGHHLSAAGPALIIANHQSFLDPVIIGLVARRPLVYLARRTLFLNPFFTFLIRSLNAVPIDQEGIGKDGIRVILEQLQLGKPVVVFPEGGRTDDGKMQPLKPGIHLLIRRTQAPIIPVGIAGAFDAWPNTRLLPTPAPLFWPAGKGTLAVVMGEPLDSSRYATMPREQALQELYDKIAVEQQHAEEIRRRW